MEAISRDIPPAVAWKSFNCEYEELSRPPCRPPAGPDSVEPTASGALGIAGMVRANARNSEVLFSAMVTMLLVLLELLVSVLENDVERLSGLQRLRQSRKCIILREPLNNDQIVCWRLAVIVVGCSHPPFPLLQKSYFSDDVHTAPALFTWEFGIGR